MSSNAVLVCMIIFGLLNTISGRVVLDNGSSRTDLTAINGRSDRLPLDDEQCRRCICKMNGCPDIGGNLPCMAAGPLCCCCYSTPLPCMNMDEFIAPNDVGAATDRLEDLEVGLEDIGQLE